MRVGVEVGGTFTDLVAIGPNGVSVTKVPSVPKTPDLGAINAIIESGIPFDAIEDLAHGSTVATNAVLERKGFPTAFVTTKGFRDILILERHGRHNIYDLEYQKPDPVVARAASFEVGERILADGSVLTPLDLNGVTRDLVPALAAGGFQAVAICLLNAYVNAEHERFLRDLLAQHLPNLHVTISSEITREFREFERASTTTLSAYVQPVIDGYIARFADRLGREGFKGRFSVMQSNGGRLPASGMRANAINALLSGPAAGVMGAVRQAARSNFSNLITLDIGGTSTDVCVVVDGKPQLTTSFSIDGLPVRVPLLDISTVGAGGGSIIWVDDGGMLRVGPQSAGADPGPACYGRSGTLPTLTDAHVVRQTVRPEAFLGGRMQLDTNAAAAALRPIAERFGLSIEAAADSAVRLANANIVRSIQLISTERGYDPRDYVLVAFGGAGPLHAAPIAEELAIKTIVIPPSAGVISAYGLIASDFVMFESLTRRERAGTAAADLVRSVFSEMKERATERAKALGLSGSLRLEFTADMRFVGQAFEVPVTFSDTEIDGLSAQTVRQRFLDAHDRIYFFGKDSDKPIEFVSFRLGITLPLEGLPLLTESATAAVAEGRIRIFDNRQWHDGLLKSRSAMRPGMSLPGPALLEDPTSTLLVPAGWTASRDQADNTILTRRADAMQERTATTAQNGSLAEDADALDPVDYAIISQALIAAAREMGTKMIRSSYSNIVREAQDASAALFDREGNVVAQAELIPMQLGPMSEIFRACAAVHPVHTLKEGDFYINNDPYGGGQHLQDVFIYSPIFYEGTLVAFAGTTAHHLDLGGGNPGLTPDAVDVHAEGLIFPPSVYNYQRDWCDGPLERLVAANIRVPSQTIGDFYAQFAANSIGAQRIKQLCGKYGASTITRAMAELVDYSERRFRAALQAIPDGTYYGEAHVDDDGLTPAPLTVRAAVTISGDTIAVDYTGTVGQVRRNLNCPWASTISATISAVKSALTSPDIPFNEGVKKPIRITAPKGTLVNPSYPAPVRARMLTAYRCFNAVLKALAQVVPDRVIADGNDSTDVTSIAYLDGDRYRVYLEVFGGGYGAGPRLDGCHAVDSPLSNCTNTPVEATDMDFEHFRIVGYGLIPDSCGHGRRRGGLGFFRSFEILKDGVNLAIYADRFRLAPSGLLGGTEAARARCEIERGGELISLPSKGRVDLLAGDILTLYTAGGGGYGAPAEREPALVEKDIAEGIITPATAAAFYGRAG